MAEHAIVFLSFYTANKHRPEDQSTVVEHGDYFAAEDDGPAILPATAAAAAAQG